MNFFLSNTSQTRPLSDEELTKLALDNKAKAEARLKKQQKQSCSCCSHGSDDDGKH